jgi:catechol 2,3-dioxygenase-like lactoylglutathione lyase family enzyme
MRLVVTTDDREQALGFYRDVLGLREIARSHRRVVGSRFLMPAERHLS